MNTREETDDIFGGGGGGVPSARLQQPGDDVMGIIYKLQKLVEKDDDGEIIYWPNSDKPKPLFVAHLITNHISEELEEDDGSRRVWLKGNGLYVLKEFVKANSLKPPAVGDTLWVRVESLKPNPVKMRKPIKQHEAKLRKGTPEDIVKAQAWAAKKEAEFLARTGQAPKGDDEFWGDGPSSTPTSGGGASNSGRRSTTMDSMRASRNAGSEAPPF